WTWIVILLTYAPGGDSPVIERPGSGDPPLEDGDEEPVILEEFKKLIEKLLKRRHPLNEGDPGKGPETLIDPIIVPDPLNPRERDNEEPDDRIVRHYTSIESYRSIVQSGWTMVAGDFGVPLVGIGTFFTS